MAAKGVEALMCATRGWENITATDVASLRSRIAPVTPATNKYKNKPCYVGDVKFQSQHEAECWLALQVMERAGTIRNLERQIPYELHCGTSSGLRICVCVYIADFRWDDVNARHVADAKSAITRMNQVYQLKKRWMALEHNIAIEEL